MRFADPAAAVSPSFTSVDDLTPADVQRWFALAARPWHAGSLPLRGRNVGVLRGERATERAVAVEAAAVALGATVSQVSASAARNDATRRAARLLGQLYDAIACEDVEASAVREIERESGVPVFDGLAADDHPAAALATLLRIEREAGRPLPTLRVAFVGDASTPLAANLVQLAALSGMTFEVVAPREHWPSPANRARAARVARATGARLAFTESACEAGTGVDVVLDDATLVASADDQQRALRAALLTALA